MEDASPFSWFVLFVKGQFVFFALALGVLWLVRRKFGGWDISDWAVAVAVGIAIAVDFIGTTDLEALYINEVGKPASAVLTRRWIQEGEDSTTFKVAVQHGKYEDDYSVSEGFYDSVTPPMNVPVMVDPDYPASFVPKFRVEAAWPPYLVLALCALAALLELLVFAWVSLRIVQRLRAAK